MAKLYFELELGSVNGKFTTERKDALRKVLQRNVDGGMDSVHHELVHGNIYHITEDGFEIIIRKQNGEYTVISVKD